MSNPSENLKYELALSLVPKIGPAVFRSILAHAGSAKGFLDITKGKASKISRISSSIIEIRKQFEDNLPKADQIISQCIKKDIGIISFSSDDYPLRLKNIDDFPLIMFKKGKCDLNPTRSVGIVGTRTCTEYGKSVTRKIIEDLAPYKPTIISGLAYGIDIEAHRAALQLDLPTIAFMGSSVDKIYPSAHASIAKEMCHSGGLASEYLPGSTMHPSNFPQRNRLIAGLSDAIVVVEAAIKGGALITAEIAYGYNKEVFAVPGNLQSPHSEGCNKLISKMKASIYTGVSDIEEALSWSKEDPQTSKFTKEKAWSQLPKEDQLILNILKEKGELDIDQLSLQTELNISELASKLLSLEFEGLIRAKPGKRYGLG
ncbi:DNA-processing protein DprA [Belliella kenyensis]|uniref:DNA-processing protein DprA n=1 Tax=Belliella kenyensis TaxID=1472724 RepID=A0ABV8EFH0_9BACT|nr:DNA-processing protein DprA [Belliella kenyensis]MCH7401906.1 DNA-processing protein DprA [Belliella kenyensis]MDN3604406.1 DNA-processing protein DprA [Belliella kenyensis]